MTNEVESKLQEEIEDKRKLPKLEDDEEYDYITVPPDGGFGWVVLVACFVSSHYLNIVLCTCKYLFSFVKMINLIVDGFMYAFGAISEDLRLFYKCDEWAVSLVISLACGFYLLSGN
jgi:hypothetical protein